MEEENIFKDPNWVLGDMAWFVLGGTIVLGLMALNAYFQRVARIEEEEDRIRLLGSDPLNRQRSADSQTRRPDDI